mgnify:CR=1 FL=1
MQHEAVLRATTSNGETWDDPPSNALCLFEGASCRDLHFFIVERLAARSGQTDEQAQDEEDGWIVERREASAAAHFCTTFGESRVGVFSPRKEFGR